MGMKDLLMHHGISEAEAERLVRENLSQMQATVAFHENMADLARLDTAEDFDSGDLR